MRVCVCLYKLDMYHGCGLSNYKQDGNIHHLNVLKQIAVVCFMSSTVLVLISDLHNTCTSCSGPEERLKSINVDLDIFTPLFCTFNIK